jgi:hypothetical protein
MENDGDPTAADFQQWPVFYGVRGDPKFTETFKSVFGVEYVPSATRQAGVHQVLEWMKDLPKDENIEAAEESYEPSASPPAD